MGHHPTVMVSQLHSINFWGDDIGYLVFKSVQKAFEKGEPSPSQRRDIIIFIHKGKRLDHDKLGNWRPISLTNTNYIQGC